MTMKLDGSNGLIFPDNSTQFSAAYTAWRNRIINGAMLVDQRNNGASVTATTVTQYTVDRMRLTTSQAGKLAGQRLSAAGAIPFEFFHRTIVSVAATAAASDFYAFEQVIEAQNTSDFLYGTSGAIYSTLSFLVRASIAGDYSVAIRNNASGNTRAYTTKFTINNANTWEPKTIIVPGDTGGNLFTGSGTGLRVWFDLGSGSNFNAAQVNAWQSSDLMKCPNTVNLVGTASAFFDVAGLQLEPGSITPFERVLPDETLRRCQRYYQQIPNFVFYMYSPGPGDAISMTLPIPPMRITPTPAKLGTWSYANATAANVGVNGVGTNSIKVSVTGNAAGFAGVTSASNAIIELPAEL